MFVLFYRCPHPHAALYSTTIAVWRSSLSSTTEATEDRELDAAVTTFEFLYGFASTQFILLSVYHPGSQALSTIFFNDLLSRSGPLAGYGASPGPLPRFYWSGRYVAGAWPVRGRFVLPVAWPVRGRFVLAVGDILNVASEQTGRVSELCLYIMRQRLVTVLFISFTSFKIRRNSCSCAH